MNLASNKNFEVFPIKTRTDLCAKHPKRWATAQLFDYITLVKWGKIWNSFDQEFCEYITIRALCKHHNYWSWWQMQRQCETRCTDHSINYAEHLRHLCGRKINKKTPASNAFSQKRVRTIAIQKKIFERELFFAKFFTAHLAGQQPILNKS